MTLEDLGSDVLERARGLDVAPPEPLGETEVQELELHPLEHQVARVHVSVDHAAGMDERQGPGQLQADPGGEQVWQLAVDLHPVAERLARHVLHGQVPAAGVGVALQVEDPGHAWVLEARPHAELPLEGPERVVARSVRADGLHRHLPPGVQPILGEQHLAHAAPAQLSDHRVAAVNHPVVGRAPHPHRLLR